MEGKEGSSKSKDTFPTPQRPKIQGNFEKSREKSSHDQESFHDSAERTLRRQIATYMQKDLENKMISFKREFSGADFLTFMEEYFPNDIITNEATGTRKPSTRMTEIAALWGVVTAKDKLYELGVPPTVNLIPKEAEEEVSVMEEVARKDSKQKVIPDSVRCCFVSSLADHVNALEKKVPVVTEEGIIYLYTQSSFYDIIRITKNHPACTCLIITKKSLVHVKNFRLSRRILLCDIKAVRHIGSGLFTTAAVTDCDKLEILLQNGTRHVFDVTDQPAALYLALALSQYLRITLRNLAVTSPVFSSHKRQRASGNSSKSLSRKVDPDKWLVLDWKEAESKRKGRREEKAIKRANSGEISGAGCDGDNVKIIKILENQRFYPGLFSSGWSCQLLPTDIPPWCKLDGATKMDIGRVTLPGPDWNWTTPWMFPVSDLTDDLGWRYAFAFHGPFTPSPGAISWVRQRLWIRKCHRVTPVPLVPLTASITEVCQNGSFEPKHEKITLKRVFCNGTRPWTDRSYVVTDIPEKWTDSTLVTLPHKLKKGQAVTLVLPCPAMVGIFCKKVKTTGILEALLQRETGWEPTVKNPKIPDYKFGGKEIVGLWRHAHPGVLALPATEANDATLIVVVKPSSAVMSHEATALPARGNPQESESSTTLLPLEGLGWFFLRGRSSKGTRLLSADGDREIPITVESRVFKSGGRLKEAATWGAIDAGGGWCYIFNSHNQKRLGVNSKRPGKLVLKRGTGNEFRWRAELIPADQCPEDALRSPISHPSDLKEQGKLCFLVNKTTTQRICLGRHLATSPFALWGSSQRFRWRVTRVPVSLPPASPTNKLDSKADGAIGRVETQLMELGAVSRSFRCPCCLCKAPKLRGLRLRCGHALCFTCAKAYPPILIKTKTPMICAYRDCGTAVALEELAKVLPLDVLKAYEEVSKSALMMSRRSRIDKVKSCPLKNF
ncbi:hypothetical protein AAMO2058_000246800, partial [Amorphochlora amoebiformis]